MSSSFIRLRYRLHYIVVGLLLIITVLSLSACGTLRWYSQAINGHLHILGQRKPIHRLLDDPDINNALKQRLQSVLDIRDFASVELHLPDNNSYREYADIGRDAPVWNVVASQTLSLQAHQWCYPLVGCLSYRGWYDKTNAQEEARELAAQNYDVLVSPSVAYSTLGWFDDPLLNTMLRYNDDQLAELIFHELAHQKVFIKGSTSFNEAFAETVANAGVTRWLSIQNDPTVLQDWRARRAVRQQINGLILKTRESLQRHYKSTIDEEERLIGKQQLILKLRKKYLDLLHAETQGSSRYQALHAWREWFAQPLNNANFVLFSVYQQGVGQFEKLLECVDNNLPDFYTAVEEMGEWDAKKRQQWLTATDNHLTHCDD